MELHHQNEKVKKTFPAHLGACFPDKSIVKNILSAESLKKEDAASLCKVILSESLTWIGRICTAALFHVMLTLYGGCGETNDSVGGYS